MAKIDAKIKDISKLACGRYKTIPQNWMPFSRVRPLIFNDPAVLWLEFHGEDNGFRPDSTPFDFLDFYGQKSREFETKWVEEEAPDTLTVCKEPYQVFYYEKVYETIKRILQGIPVIAKPALWWAPERIYGVPDLIVKASWLSSRFPNLELSTGETAESLQDHYIVVDIKFTTTLKEKDWTYYKAQARFASYVLGHIQSYMPKKSYLITRDQVRKPLTIDVDHVLEESLKQDLATLRDKFVDIKINGDSYKPWIDAVVDNNPKNPDERWQTAKNRITWEKALGGDLRCLYQIGDKEAISLKKLGYESTESLLAKSPDEIDLEAIKGIGEVTAGRLRAILQANRTGKPVIGKPLELLRNANGNNPFEFYVDFEYFTNLNVDFNKQRDSLEGHKMVFMIGIGWEESGKWHFESQHARTEDQDGERELFEWFIGFLKKKCGRSDITTSQTEIYHWSNAEVWQSRDVADRLGWDSEHPLRKLNWIDLQKIFIDCQAAIPGAWDFGLKQVAKALGRYDSKYDTHWVGDLDSGLSAMILGWKIYAGDDRFKKEGFSILEQYLQADCKALWQVLRWLRTISKDKSLTERNTDRLNWEQIVESLKLREELAYAAQNVEKGQEKGVVVYLHPGKKGKKGLIPINHLIWGDRLSVLEKQADWCKIQARNTTGWVHQTMIQADSLLEVNFVDVGQGDGCFIVTPASQYILFDAGVSDHMYRFLRWYFAHFKRKVNFKAAIISHPDADHYYGFQKLFDEKDPATRNISFEILYHNGIMDAGSKERFLKGVVSDWPTLKIRLESNLGSGNYFNLLRRAWNNKQITDRIEMLWTDMNQVTYLKDFGQGQPLEIRVLAPVPDVTNNPNQLPWFSGGGPTKNGNSIVLKLKYNKVSMLLGGDLNTKAEEYLLNHYGEETDVFKVQLAKSCHHGSGDFSPEFLKAIDAIATVISSGDDETYSHPRPDSLGALGRYSKADRPLIFSTELARSAPEKVKHPLELQEEFWQAQVKEQQTEFVENLLQRLGRTVAVYGMITVRTDGKDILLAQKLERAKGHEKKWDLHLLEYDHENWKYTPSE